MASVQDSQCLSIGIPFCHLPAFLFFFTRGVYAGWLLYFYIYCFFFSCPNVIVLFLRLVNFEFRFFHLTLTLLVCFGTSWNVCSHSSWHHLKDNAKYATHCCTLHMLTTVKCVTSLKPARIHAWCNLLRGFTSKTLRSTTSILFCLKTDFGYLNRNFFFTLDCATFETSFISS